MAWNWTSQLQDQVSRDVASREVVTDLLQSAGANDDSQIVLFGDNNNWFAAYALWMLELYGVTNTALMDGGRVKWEAEGRATTTDAAGSRLPAASPSPSATRRCGPSCPTCWPTSRLAANWSTCARRTSSTA